MNDAPGKTSDHTMCATSVGSPYRRIGTRRRANFCLASSGIPAVMPLRLFRGRTFLVASAGVIVANLLVNLFYGLLDPRVRT